MRPTVRHARFALASAAFLSAISVVWFALNLPSKGWWGPDSDRSAAPYLIGQLTLIAIWAALGTTPWFLRWMGAAAAFCVTALPVLQVDSTTLRSGVQWALYVSWLILPSALLSFTVLCLLREIGVLIVPVHAEPVQTRTIRRFTLRTMFVWTAGAAVISLAWAQLLALESSLPRIPWQNLLVAFSMRMTDPAICILVGWATLRRKPLRWWMVALVPAIILVQTAAIYLTHSAYAPMVGGPRTWQQTLKRTCEGDPLYLGPLIGVLLLARAAGYRVK
jgi:hypothetical protein